MGRQVFISHGDGRCELAVALGKALESAGLDIHLDRRLLRDDSRLKPETKAAIDAADGFLAMIGPENQGDSKWVAQETQYALQAQQQRGSGLRIIPILLDGAELGALRWLLPEGAAAVPLNDGEAGVSKAASRVLETLWGQPVKGGVN